jgi:hypothetical protein
MSNLNTQQFGTVKKAPGAGNLKTGYCPKCDRSLPKDYYSDEDVHKALKKHHDRMHKGE